jgi:selenocysteine lyase/cysteine desulfurase
MVFTAEDFKTAESIQLRVEEFVNSYPKKIKMVVIDHISSMPSIVFPIDTLQAFFEEKGIMFVVDGAHAIGNVNVNIAEMNPNAYFSNFHKWAFCPKNASFLYLDDKYRDIVKPVITGNFHGEGPEREFYWTGTRDFSSYLTIRKGIEYHESFGVGAVIAYNHNIALQGAKRMG